MKIGIMSLWITMIHLLNTYTYDFFPNNYDIMMKITHFTNDDTNESILFIIALYEYNTKLLKTGHTPNGRSTRKD